MAKPSGDEATEDAVRAAATAVYAAPLAEMIAVRTELARTAKTDGRREVAAAITALRKPSVAAWAINQAVRAEPDAGAELADLGRRLRHATATMDAAQLSKLRPEREHTLASWQQTVATVADRAGVTLSSAVQDEVRATAVAALADEAAEQVALSGSLTRALHYSGFGEVDVVDAVARTSTGVPLVALRGSAGDQHAGTGDSSTEAAPDAKESSRGAAAALEQARERVAEAEREAAIRASRAEASATRATATAERVAKLRADLATAEREADDAKSTAETDAASAAQAAADHAAALEALGDLGEGS